jgi:uncharacterized protein
VVTGASAGFGETFARELAKRGMNLVLTARRGDRLEALARKLRSEHAVETVVIALDLAAVGQAAPLWERASEGREIDLLVNNAGVGAHGSFHSVERERHVQLVQLNCIAPLELMHMALVEMRRRGSGGIINLGSTSAFQPVPMVATYAATKAFLLSLSEAVWAENRKAGVRVLALCPGRSPTEFQAAAGTTPVSSIPTVILPPEQIVAEGLRAFEKDRPFVVPGFTNYLGTFAHRLLPRGFLARAIHRVSRHII